MSESHIETVDSSQPAMHEGFPWKHVIGYVLSILLTVMALWLVFSLQLPLSTEIVSILILAVFQVMIQLLLFMHLNEKDGPAYHVISLIFGAFIALTIVGGSIWIMAFRNMVS